MRGRKPIPSKIIELRGGSRLTHRPPRSGDPRPEPKIPPCPRGLGKVARKEWRRTSKKLYSLGILSTLDLAALSIYCTAWENFLKAGEELAKTGPFIRGKEGFPVRNPWFRIQGEAVGQLRAMMAELGLSASSRSRIKVEKPKSRSAEDEFLNSGKGEG